MEVWNKGKSKLTDEAKTFIKDNYPSIDCNALVPLIFEKFSIKCSDGTIRRFLEKEGLKIPREMFTKEMKEWIKENYMNYRNQEPFFNDFQKVFHTGMTLNSFACRISRDGINHFKGNSGSPEWWRCPNRKKVGETSNINGTVYIKVKDDRKPAKINHCSDNDNWRVRSHVVYEQHYGEIPKNHQIIHIDGDSTNDNIENLIAIPKGIQGAVGNEFGKVEDKDTYRTLLKLKTLEHQIKKGTYGK